MLLLYSEAKLSGRFFTQQAAFGTEYDLRAPQVTVPSSISAGAVHSAVNSDAPRGHQSSVLRALRC